MSLGTVVEFLLHVEIDFTWEYCDAIQQLLDTVPAVLRIHDILRWIRILLFSSMTFKMPAKN